MPRQQTFAFLALSLFLLTCAFSAEDVATVLAWSEPNFLGQLRAYPCCSEYNPGAPIASVHVPAGLRVVLFEDPDCLPGGPSGRGALRDFITLQTSARNLGDFSGRTQCLRVEKEGVPGSRPLSSRFRQEGPAADSPACPLCRV